MSGEPPVRLDGPATAGLVVALARLESFDFALVGGLAVMARLGRVHRATQDLDGVFDNPSDEPTTVRLVAATDPGELAHDLASTPWMLDAQVREALARDVASDYEAGAALLRGSTVPEIAATDPDDFIEVMHGLIEALSEANR